MNPPAFEPAPKPIATRPPFALKPPPISTDDPERFIFPIVIVETSIILVVIEEAARDDV